MKKVTIWRGWGLKGSLSRQVAVAKAAKKRGLGMKADARKVRALDTKGTTK